MAETWAVVLAGGDGQRLRAITTNREGLEIPKQYCSIRPPGCLLQNAISRAGSVALASHVCAVVAAQHRRWWASCVEGLNESNVIVQPRNKGTAIGILLALLTLEKRNAGSTIVLLPADHYFRDEDTITRALRVATNLASADPEAAFLLGADPECPDSGLGYIVPAERVLDKPSPITGFTEKPSIPYAQELISLGALWNLFILVGSATALLRLFADKHADTVSDMRKALQRDQTGRSVPFDEFYQRIEPIDFSRSLLEIQATHLQVIRVPHCGWTDLGTPQRVEATLRGIEQRTGLSNAGSKRGDPLFLDLAAQFSLRQ